MHSARRRWRRDRARSDLARAGVGSPGEVDEVDRLGLAGAQPPGWEGTSKPGQWLAEALGTPVSVGNDVGVATAAEAKLGAGRDYNSLIGVSGAPASAAASSSTASRGSAVALPARSATWS